MSNRDSWRFGITTDAGRVRDHNEDAYLAKPPVYAVADGMGGHAAGEVASRLAIESLSRASLDAGGGRQAIRTALIEANRLVFDTANEDGGSRGMGSTCALLLFRDGVAHIGHVGDSRIYRLREHVLMQLTRDHTVVGEMVDKGLLDPSAATVDENRGYLTRALGGAGTVEPDVQSVEVLAGDRYLLCSDGLSTMIDHGEIEGILNSTVDPQQAADELVAAANAAGGEDNITALVVDAPLAEPRRRRSAKRWLVFVAIGLVVLALVVAAILFLRIDPSNFMLPRDTGAPATVSPSPDQLATHPTAPQ